MEYNAVGNVEFETGTGGNPEHRYFTHMQWSRDSSWFTMTWISRAATQSKAIACKIVDSSCSVVGHELGGIDGEYVDDKWVNGNSGKYSGWVGSFQPFYLMLTKTFGEYFTVYSRKIENAIDSKLHPYGISIQDGFWNVAFQAENPSGQPLGGITWLTDSREGRWAVTSLNFFDEQNGFLYFTAARSVSVGSDAKTEQRKRQIFRVKYDPTSKKNFANDPNPECVTCSLDVSETGHCGYMQIRRNCEDCSEMVFIANCRGSNIGGYKVPRAYRTKQNQDFSLSLEWELLEANKPLEARLATKSLTSVDFSTWQNAKFGVSQNYEVYRPANFDSSGKKKYALFLEVYAGPEFQKVQETYKSGWAQVHFPSAYDCITVSVDGRGSAFQGDRFMFANYKALGQTEPVDQTGIYRLKRYSYHYCDI